MQGQGSEERKERAGLLAKSAPNQAWSRLAVHRNLSQARFSGAGELRFLRSNARRLRKMISRSCNPEEDLQIVWMGYGKAGISIFLGFLRLCTEGS